MASIEIRVLGVTGIEDYHAHLLRLDPHGRSLCLVNDGDDRGIDSHCLRLLATQPILIGGYVNGTLRTSLEIVPDRTARRADAVFTAEPKFNAPVLTEMLLERLFDEARSYRLSELKLYGISEATLLACAAFTTGVEIVVGAALRLRFIRDMQMPMMPAIAASATRYA